MSMPNKTRVQVATDSNFSNIIVDTTSDYKTTLSMAAAELPVGSNLYIRGMHGHPDTGDSPWSTVHQFKVMLPYANQLYYTAGTFNFTVPAGVTSVCIAMAPGADYSTAGELLKTYIGRTTACAAGDNSVPVGISSITLSGKGAAGTSSTVWNRTSVTDSHGMGIINVIPITISDPPPSTIYISQCKSTATRISLTATTAYYEGSYTAYDQTSSYTITYTKGTTSTTTGASTTAVVNGTTYTFPGGTGGAAAVTNHTVAINKAIGATISANIAAGGSLSYSYSAYAINALGTLLGNNFTLSPVAKDIGTYVGGIAAWRNNIPVVPSSTIPVRVGSGGAVNIIWGTGRSFPNSEV